MRKTWLYADINGRLRRANEAETEKARKRTAHRVQVSFPVFLKNTAFLLKPARSYLVGTNHSPDPGERGGYG